MKKKKTLFFSEKSGCFSVSYIEKIRSGLKRAYRGNVEIIARQLSELSKFEIKPEHIASDYPLTKIQISQRALDRCCIYDPRTSVARQKIYDDRKKRVFGVFKMMNPRNACKLIVFFEVFNRISDNSYTFANYYAQLNQAGRDKLKSDIYKRKTNIEEQLLTHKLVFNIQDFMLMQNNNYVEKSIDAFLRDNIKSRRANEQINSLWAFLNEKFDIYFEFDCFTEIYFDKYIDKMRFFAGESSCKIDSDTWEMIIAYNLLFTKFTDVRENPQESPRTGVSKSKIQADLLKKAKQLSRDSQYCSE